MRKTGLLLICLMMGSLLQADGVYFKLGNSHAAFPFSRFGKLLYRDFHMNYEIGKSFTLKSGPKYEWFQTANLGFVRHKFVQSVILLYSENGYQRKLSSSVDVNTKLGLGYYHMFTGTERVEQNSNGDYEVKRDWGRPQAIITFSIGLTRSLVKNVNTAPKILIDYQLRLQTPYISPYVPLLPYNTLKVGMLFTLHDRDA